MPHPCSDPAPIPGPPYSKELRLSLQSMRWQVAQPVGPDQLERFSGLPPLIVQLLYNRGLTEPGAAGGFLDGRSGPDNPFALAGVPAAVTRLRRAIRRQERIAVYGDFDADGVAATALLVETLAALGAQVKPYIPHRVDEGYGLHLDALRDLYRQKVRVVVTVDCGIRSLEEVERASRGLDLIITDHHSLAAELPPAVAVVNPKRPDSAYPSRDLAGVGVALKLGQALLRAGGRQREPPALDEGQLLDLVALGTVADLVPLLGENRALVQQGLERMNHQPRPGIEALMAEAGVRRGEVDAATIGFRLAPRLNAAGRLDTAMLAYRLLRSRDPLETRALAQQLDQLNRRRQELTEQTVAEAEAQVLAEDADARLYLAAGPRFLPGIVGLAASRLTEAYHRPSVVVELGEEESRGSCRSIPEFDITAALDQCSDLLIRYGGHRAAAGFTVATHKLAALARRLKDIAAKQLADVDLRPLLHIDVELPLEEVDWATHALLQQMEPCGMDNPQPVLLSRGVQVRDQRATGDEQRHLKLGLRDSRGVFWDAIFFRHGHLLADLPDRVDLAYTLDVNVWNGERRLQLNVQDLREATGSGLP
jgi:single-stranded-DNA-specific exonuclease